MLIRKAFRFRVYPTPKQKLRLSQWEGALRSLWNVALEQRVNGLNRSEKRYPTAFDQINELTELRKDCPWLAEVPRDVSNQLLIELDKSVQRCFKRIAKFPRWKRKGKDFPGICEPHPKAWKFKGSNISFPKIGQIRTIKHRELEGKPKSCALKREGDQWFASIVCEIEAPEPIKRGAPVIAIDRGVNQLLADSDGNLTKNPKYYEKTLKKLAFAQRALARKEKGSNRRKKAANRVMRIHRKVRRQREYFLHNLSSTITKSNGVVVIEKLNVAGMIRSNLARHIADAGWSRFAEMLRYKLAWSGGTLLEVPAHYSSQTCSACGAVDAASRKAERFCCTVCGYVDHADVNAAKVLKSRANRSVMPVDGTLPEGAGRSGKEKVKLRVSRRSPFKSSVL